MTTKSTSVCKKIIIMFAVALALVLATQKSEAIVFGQEDCYHLGSNHGPMKFATIPWYMTCQSVHAQMMNHVSTYCDGHGHLINGPGLSIPGVILYDFVGQVSSQGCNKWKQQSQLDEPGSPPETCTVHHGGGGADPFL